MREISRDGDQKAEEQRMTGAPSMPSGAEGDAFNGSAETEPRASAPCRENRLHSSDRNKDIMATT